MSREAIEVAVFTWSRIQLHDADPVAHRQRCRSEGLQCPREVFAQLFHLSRTCLSSHFGLTQPIGHNRPSTLGSRFAPNRSFVIATSITKTRRGLPVG
jgi:ribosomal protein S14